MTSPNNSSTEVLIAGAGPTGLVLALWLTRLGVRVRIVDKLAAPETTSRAIGVQARTLEFYRQFGMADDFIERGLKAPALNLWVSGSKRARLGFEKMGAGISPFPYALVLSQDEHEHLLIERLSALGVNVDRGTELIGFVEAGNCMRAELKHADGTTEMCEAVYIAGCDGARSIVRETMGGGFAGGTYDHRFYVADVDATGPAMNGEVNVALDAADFLVIFPLKNGRARLIGTVLGNNGDSDTDLTWNDVNKTVIEELRLEIKRLNWFSTYRVHHRVANRFRKGCAFLLGDAAHIHSPVGGQGMNTGIGDAVNLAWKLAAVLRGRADASLLDTYEPERIAFAHRLVTTTDRVFTGVTSAKPFDRWARLNIVPVLLPILFRFAPVRKFMFSTVSQAIINYRDSSLSEGRAGGVHGGDRLPWVKIGSDDTQDNFAPLTSMDWQVHVYGEPSGGIRTICEERKLPLCVFPWQPDMARTGLHRNAVYLVRPDGHVAVANREGGAAAIASYLDARKIISRGR